MVIGRVNNERKVIFVRKLVRLNFKFTVIPVSKNFTIEK